MVKRVRNRLSSCWFANILNRLLCYLHVHLAVANSSASLLYQGDSGSQAGSLLVCHAICPWSPLIVSCHHGLAKPLHCRSMLVTFLTAPSIANAIGLCAVKTLFTPDNH